MYLHCSDNNRAGTVLQLFKEAAGTYGLPSRIHIDKGDENVDISMFMLTHPLHGSDRGHSYCG